MTAYYVLRSSTEGAWEEVELTNARSSLGAIRNVVLDGDSARYVAIPARSFKPVTVKVETKTALRFS